MADLKTGDVVTLCSGGPLMTITTLRHKMIEAPPVPPPKPKLTAVFEEQLASGAVLEEEAPPPPPPVRLPPTSELVFCDCSWFDTYGQLKGGSFPPAALKKASST
ncbi:MAG: DUF2158 domain-containing protein [Chloroflexota bacterium]|nr:DUF2158 domain-containing protein [Chloroflexota bacterium]